MNKTIEIRKVHIINLFLSFIFGFGILYCLEHFGKFSYIVDDTNLNNHHKTSFESIVPVTTKVLKINYHSFFGSRVETNGNGFDLYDMNYKDSDFKKYSVKSYYYTQATLNDLKYGLYISFGLFILTLFFTNFKIKFT